MDDGLKRLLVLMGAVVLLLLVCAAAESPALEAKGYVYITAGGDARWYALPESGEYEVTVRVTDADGHVNENTVRITEKGAVMAYSNCEGQDCMGQGEVTLANKELRILGSWIICLPHQLTVELFSAQEVRELLAAQ